MLVTAAAAAQNPPAASAPPNGALQTFELAKPPALASTAPERPLAAAPARGPNASESLRTMIGLGYVQGADWGSEILAGGSIAGAQVHLNTLITSGRDGLVFDQGTLSIFDPNTKWRVEAGDVFSHLRGAASGGRVSWAAKGNRRPAIAVYVPRRGTLARRTVVTYRDQVKVGEQTVLDAEVASDRSFLLSSRVAFARFEMEAFHRAQRRPFSSSDRSISGGVTLWRGVSLSGGAYESAGLDDRNTWRMVSVRLPISRFMDVTLERAFAGSRESNQTTSAAMASIAAGNLRLFHRYQHGEYELGPGFSGSVERQQIRSMSSYSAGSRLNLTLQLATQRTDTGQVQHWEELQATLKITRTTTLRTVTAVPDVRNPERFQGHLRQELPRRLAIQADYGRLSAYQAIPHELDRSRFKVLLFKTFDLATPARGATVTGRVADNLGRGVAGARVKLGPYTADTDASGVYRFAHVPRGEYDLSLDSHLLPADFAWDGRHERLAVTSTRALRADLQVTPLNAIHGRVYVDANGNGRFDTGEAVRGAVLAAGDRLTATDHAGAYSFYNLWPGVYTIRLRSLPAAYQPGESERVVTLVDGAPVTGADFRALAKDKPIIWERTGR